MSSPAVILLIVNVVLIAEFLLEAFASRAQLAHQPEEVPAELARQVDAESYRKAKAYAAARERHDLWRGGFVVSAWIVLLATGALGSAYGRVDAWLGSGWLGAVAFLGLLALAFDLALLPFSIWRTFGIEERFGFNRTTWRTFWRDKLMTYLVSLVLGGGLLALLLASYEWWGRAFWIPYAVVVAVVATLLAMFQTSLLLPLFNKLTPLADGQLRDEIESYLQGVGYQLGNLYVMDGSKRSSKVNAFFSGLGPVKKVVLYDTLIERHPSDEVVAVVAHEVGHHRRRHVPWLLSANLAALTLMLFVASRLIDAQPVSRALGAEGVVPALNLVAFVLLYGPVNLVVGAVVNALSRRFEYQADAFAAESHRGFAMIAALERLVDDNLALATAHPLYAALKLTHPAPVDRIRALTRAD